MCLHEPCHVFCIFLRFIGIQWAACWGNYMLYYAYMFDTPYVEAGTPRGSQLTWVNKFTWHVFVFAARLM